MRLVSAMLGVDITGRSGGIPDVPTPEQPPLVPGGPVIRAGGGRNWKYKIDTPDASAPLVAALLRMAPAPLVLKQLLERGEDVHARSSVGYCALHVAITCAAGTGQAHESKCLQCIDVLLEPGADPNAMDYTGFAPAHFCATAPVGSAVSVTLLEAMLRRLLDAGADLSLTNHNADSASMLAAKNPNPALRQLFQRLEVEYAAKQMPWKQQLEAQSVSGATQ